MIEQVSHTKIYDTKVYHTEMYCDGGVIKKNPSTIGGSWSWCWVLNGEIISWNRGIVLPSEIGMKHVTNNYTELLAAVYALESVPEGWEGTLYTDSLITLRRVNNSPTFNGISKELRERCVKLRSSVNRKYKVVLVTGHPTNQELIDGISRKGRPVSKFNVFCDKQCKLATEYYLKSLENK